MSRFLDRAQRARLLAERYPALSQALLLFANLSELQAQHASRDAFRALAPQAPEEWFDRIFAETEPTAIAAHQHDNLCPRCQAPPQLGILRPQGDGAALYLACAVCREEWPFRRTLCPECGAADHLSFFRSDQFPALITQTCDACKTYLHLIDAGKDPQVVPEADEIAAQPLDVWAREQGYRKIAVNLLGF